MQRFFDEDRFEIYALRDLHQHEELTHLYKSMEWRACFQDLRLSNSSEGSPETEVTVASGESLVDCSKVEVRPDGHGGAGVFAAVPLRRGELVERGIVRRLPVDGNTNPYVFTWSEDRSVWASGSGCSVFYNASLDGSENTEVVRHLDQDRFEIFALRDIDKGEELTHLYKSMEWRSCFRDLKTQRDLAGLKKLDKQRADFTEYWASDHSAATLENMMLDSDAAVIDKLERPEILSHMPSLHGKSVLELGAGIGRFSGILARKAQRVVAVDFVHASCEENKRANADKPNLQVLQADVTTLNLAPGSFDLVFSNWLFMYLTDEECQELAKNILTWLRPGGHMFLRESCFHASGWASTARIDCRDGIDLWADVFACLKFYWSALATEAREYDKALQPNEVPDAGAVPGRVDFSVYSQFFSDANVESMRYQLCGTNFVESYAQLKGNMHQFWFRWQKVGVRSDRHLMLLQTGQYSPAKILRYEKIYGRGYIYTGGDRISEKIMQLCSGHLQPGARCLDIGAGAGGTAYFLTQQNPGIYVHAVNWSSELASVNAGRMPQVPEKVRRRVTFELTPESGVPENELRYPPNAFDVAVLRETLMYLEKQDKAVILRKVARLLRPGGRLVVIDYCAGKPREEMSEAFREHIHRWHYELVPAKAVEELLEHYFEVTSQDCTQESRIILERAMSPSHLEKERASLPAWTHSCRPIHLPNHPSHASSVREDFVKFMDEGLQQIEANLGPSTWGPPEELQILLSGCLESRLKDDRCNAFVSEVAAQACVAAMEKVELHKAALESSVESLGCWLFLEGGPRCVAEICPPNGCPFQPSAFLVWLRSQKLDYDWARETWTLEKKAALNGDLRRG
ncbi:PEAMT [Symbiodinium natans]|uniref:phosphoethanolamine N-methyltransferase n=1 Tax=Symbiodinium natans TaxID=878477 RepID=A0A812TKA8_9DINO|nr:PEAMT [Symbiodinium natans]